MGEEGRDMKRKALGHHEMDHREGGGGRLGEGVIG
jgi:hypothetical protein